MKIGSAVAAFAKQARKDYVLGLHLPEGERLYHFCVESRLVPDIEEEPGREMCRELEMTIPEMGSHRIINKLYLAPRNTFKTSIVQAFAIYLMLLYPDIRILLIRATHDDAIGILRSIRQSLTGNKIILEVWGDFEKTALVWTETAITIGSRDTSEMALKEPTIDTAGIGVSKTGYHPDVVLIDDPVHENNYRSAKARADGRLTIEALEPIMEMHGTRIVTGTRWAENDLYGWIMEQDEERVRDAARAGEDDPESARLWTKYIRSAYDLGDADAGYNADGTARVLFFPNRLTWEYLKRQRSAVDIKLYTAWFENRASVDATKLFRPEYMTYFEASYFAYPMPVLEFATGLVVPLRVKTFIDPSMGSQFVAGGSQQGDSVGIVTIGWDARDDEGVFRWWILSAREIRKTPSGQTFEIVKELREFVPEEVVFEAAGGDPEMIARVALAIRDMELATRITSYSVLRDEKADGAFERKGRRGKYERIKALEPIFREGRALLRRGRCAVLVSQLLKFPDTDRDDVADGLAMGRVAAMPCDVKTQVEMQSKLEDIEEKLSWGPDGPPQATRPRVPPGTNVGAASSGWKSPGLRRRAG